MISSYQSAFEGEENVRCLVAMTIEEAERIIQNEQFDLVVLDGNVPKVLDEAPVSTDGLLALLRRSFDGPVLCCASDLKQRKIQFALAGDNSYSCEKWDVPDRVRSIRMILRR